MNKTIHTPRDQNFHFSDKIDFNQQNGAERQIVRKFTNQFRNLRSNCVTENKIYRLALDSILYDGHMAHEVRLRDRSSGLMVYSTYQTEFSSFTRNYNTQSRLIMLATIASPGVFGGGFYSNLVSYWTLANEWISDP